MFSIQRLHRHARERRGEGRGAFVYGAVCALIGLIMGYMLVVAIVFGPIAWLHSVVVKIPVLREAIKAACAADVFGWFDDSCDVVELSDSQQAFYDKSEAAGLNEQIRQYWNCYNRPVQSREAGTCDTTELEGGRTSVFSRDRAWLVNIYIRAAQRYNVSWQVVAALHAAKSNFGADNCSEDGRSGGQFAFTKKEWARYKVDAGTSEHTSDGDCWKITQPDVEKGIEGTSDVVSWNSVIGESGAAADADPRDPADAIFTEARMISDLGAAGVKSWEKYNGDSARGCVVDETIDGKIYPVPNSDDSTTLAGGSATISGGMPVAPEDLSAENSGPVSSWHGSEFESADAEGASGPGGRKHAAYDLFARGDAPLYSMVSGTVYRISGSDNDSGQVFGRSIYVEDSSTKKVVVYRHTNADIEEGASVSQGQRVGSVKSWAGGASHVHIEIWKNRDADYQWPNMEDPFPSLEAIYGSSGSGSSTPGTSISNPSAGTLSGVGDIPDDYLNLYVRAAAQYKGMHWALLAAIGKKESDHGRSNLPGVKSGVNYAGCCSGPMQFDKNGTWPQYAVDGNGDGRKDIYDPADAIPAAAKYLDALTRGDNDDQAKVKAALNHYVGQSEALVRDRLALADEYEAKGTAKGLPAVPYGTSLAGGGSSGGGGATTTVSGGAMTGDTAAIKAAITAYLEKKAEQMGFRSMLLEATDEIAAGAVQWKTSPWFLIAVAGGESSLGRDASAKAANNPFGMLQTGHGSPLIRYDSVKEAVKAWYKNLNTNNAYAGKTTVAAIGDVYCYGNCPNWDTNIPSLMTEMGQDLSEPVRELTIGGSGGGSGAGSGGASSGPKIDEIPDELIPVYKRAAATEGIPWTLLAGVAAITSDHARSTASGAKRYDASNKLKWNYRMNGSGGRLGPFQLTEAINKRIGIDGNADKKKNLEDPFDAAQTAAHFLALAGATAPAGVQKALKTYGGNDEWVAKVNAKVSGYSLDAAVNRDGSSGSSGASAGVPVTNTSSGSSAVAGGMSRDRLISDITAVVQRRANTSPLIPLIPQMVDIAIAGGVDPRFVFAIAGSETSFATTGCNDDMPPSDPAACHNPFGYGVTKHYDSFLEITEEIVDALVNGPYYLKDGRRTVAEIQERWAPVGASNDPGNLNSNWLTVVSAFLTEMGGDPSKPVIGNPGSLPQGGSGGSAVGGEFSGRQPTDKISKALLIRVGESEKHSACYVAQVHEWYLAIRDGVGAGAGGTAASGGTVLAQAIIEAAKTQLGTPYVWGGSSPGAFDCSGLVWWAYDQAGVKFTRQSTFEWWGGSLGDDWIKGGTDQSQLQPADMVFFGTDANPHHVGLYIGDGQYIQAPQTGDVVKISNMSDRSDFIGYLRSKQVSTAAGAGSGAGIPTSAGKPTIESHLIPFSDQRKQWTADYNKRHYGQDTWKLTDPKLIAIHYTAGGTAASARQGFLAANGSGGASNGENPNTCAHYVIDTDGAIWALVPTSIRCRHVIGINHTAIGIEVAATSEDQIFGRPAQLASLIKLTRWLQSKYQIPLDHVVGHGEVNPVTKPQPAAMNEYIEKVYSPQQVVNLLHSDWTHEPMQKLREMLADGTTSTSARRD